MDQNPQSPKRDKKGKKNRRNRAESGTSTESKRPSPPDREDYRQNILTGSSLAAEPVSAYRHTPPASEASDGTQEQRHHVDPMSQIAPGLESMGPTDSQLGMSIKVPNPEDIQRSDDTGRYSQENFEASILSENNERNSSATEHKTRIRKGYSRTIKPYNVSELERVASVSLGFATGIYGLSKLPGLGAWLSTLAGLTLISRGLTGHSILYEKLEVDSTQKGLEENKGLLDPHPYQVKRSHTIWRSKDEVFKALKEADILQKLIPKVQKVEKLADGLYRFEVLKSKTNSSFHIDIRIDESIENEKLLWSVLPEGKMLIKGQTILRDAPKTGATEVYVSLDITPPLGAIGTSIIKAFGPLNRQLLGIGLNRLKQVVETGEVASIEGQPSKRSSTAGVLDDIPSKIFAAFDRIREKTIQTNFEGKEAS